MNQGSIPARGKIKLSNRLKTKKNRITVTITEITLLLNRELKKKVKLRTAARYNNAKSNDSPN